MLVGRSAALSQLPDECDSITITLRVSGDRLEVCDAEGEEEEEEEEGTDGGWEERGDREEKQRR